MTKKIENVGLVAIESAAKELELARRLLADRVQFLQQEVAKIQELFLPGVKRLVVRAASHHAQLKGLIEAAPDLFERPRTVVFHGIRLGYAKGKGKIEIEDEARTIALIRKHLPELADGLISVVESPNKVAMKDLPVGDLKRIGCTVEEAGDYIVIKPVDDAVEKAVKALLKDATEEAVAA